MVRDTIIGAVTREVGFFNVFRLERGGIKIIEFVLCFKIIFCEVLAGYFFEIYILVLCRYMYFRRDP